MRSIVRRLRRAGTALLVTLSIFYICPGQAAWAQDGDRRFNLAWRGIPLDQALAEFATAAELDLGFEPLLVAGKTVFCVARNASVEEVLRCLLDGSGLDFYRRSSGLYVIAPSAESPPLYGNLRGIILDSDSRQPISNAHVFLAEATRGRVANESGMFAFFRLLPGSYHLTVSHLGYRTTTREVEVVPGGNEQTEVALDAQAILISPLVIDGLGMQPSSTLLGHAFMDQESMAMQTGLPGSGALPRLDALPGVRVNDATADVHIQGGEAGEHQFRLDGAPVFIPASVANFVGPFSPFALGSVRVNKAGFGVPLGSHISGVIEAEHDLRFSGPVSGPPRGGVHRRFVVQADPISLNGRFSGFTSASSGVQASFMTAARVGIWRLGAPASLRGLLDGWNGVDTFLLSAFASRNAPFTNYPPVGRPEIGFLDLHAASRVRIGPLRTIYGSAYMGSSRLGNNLAGAEIGDDVDPLTVLGAFRDIYTWRTYAAQLKYETVLGPRTLGSVRLRASGYRLRHDFDARDEGSQQTLEDDGNRIYETALEVRADHALTDHSYVEGGLDAIVTGDRFTVAGTQLLPLEHEFTSFRTAGFAQHRVQLGDHVALESGSRFTYDPAQGSVFAEPRASIRADWLKTRTGNWSVFFGTGIYRQFVNQFDVSSRSPRTFVSSTRFWMAVDSTVAPPKSAHAAAEIFWRPGAEWSVNAEAHYKRHYHALALDYSATPNTGSSATQSSFLRSSTGSTAGYGVTVRRALGAGNARIRYEYTHARRSAVGLFGNQRLDAPWNEPHRIELGMDLVPAVNVVLLARWRTIVGRTWGYRQAYYDFLSAYVSGVDDMLAELRAAGVSANALERIERQVTHYDLASPDEHRLPPIHQLDLSAAWSTTLGGVRFQTRIDLVNVLNSDNVAEWRFLLDENRYFGLSEEPAPTGILDRDSRGLLPRVLTFAVKATF